MHTLNIEWLNWHLWKNKGEWKWKKKQHESETTSAFITRLQDVSTTCNFENYSAKTAILDNVISKCLSNKLLLIITRTTVKLKTLLEISFRAEQQAVETEKM